MNSVKRTAVAAVVGAGLAALVFWAHHGEARAFAAVSEPPGQAAVVDVLGVVEKMVESERYKPAREEFQQKAKEKVDAARAAMQEIEGKAKGLDNASPEMQALRTQYGAKQQEEQETRASVEEQNTKQVAEAYRIAIETAGAIAKREGFAYVVSSRTGPDLIRSNSINTAVQEILARPVVVLPTGADLTPAVLAELKLDAVAVPVPPAAGGGKGEEKK